MSKQVYVTTIQPDPEGPVFGRVMQSIDFRKSQQFAHEHIQQVVRDLLVAGAADAQVAGFAAVVAGTLHVSVAKGSAVDPVGISYDSESDDATVVALNAAHVTLPRIDLIYATLEADAQTESEFRPFRRLRTSAEEEAHLGPYPQAQENVPTELHTRVTIGVKTGVANVAPAAPAVGAGEVALWQVHVAANQTVLTNDDLTDVRVLAKSLYQVLAQLTTLETNLSEVIDDRVAALLAVINGLTESYDDGSNTLTLSFDPETIDDRVNALLVDSPYLTKSYNDAGNLLTIDVDLSALVAALNPTYVNVAGDTMTGDLAHIRTVAGANIVNSFDTSGNAGANNGGAHFDLLHGGLIAAYIRIKDRSALPASGAVIEFGVFNADSGGYVPPSSLMLLRSDKLFVFEDVAITGNLSKGSGTFLIDHPLDPDNKDLAHAFIESPRHDLIYRGRVQLVAGEAVVDIDAASGMTAGTFAALVQNVQFMQPYAETGWDKVRIQDGSFDGSSFTIECENPASTAWVSWALIAERHDAFIQASPENDEDGHLIVERDKPEPDESLLAPTTVEIAGEEESSEVVDQVVSDLIGTAGYRRHARETGAGTVPMREVTINTVVP